MLKAFGQNVVNISNVLFGRVINGEIVLTMELANGDIHDVKISGYETEAEQLAFFKELEIAYSEIEHLVGGDEIGG